MRVFFLIAAGLLATPAGAQTAANLAAFRGVAPAGALLATHAGTAVLARNEAETSAIQAGTAGEPLLAPFAGQQRQALADAFITSANANELADGLGTGLADAYRADAPCTSPDDGKTLDCRANASPRLAALFAYAVAVTGADAAAGKYFMANETRDGSKKVSMEAAGIFAAAGATADVVGKFTHHPAGAPGADKFGNSRPFQTEPGFVKFTAPDFFGVPASNAAYLFGPVQNLTNSPSFPSGHTTYGMTESLLLAMMVPERFAPMLARGAEYGNDRIIMGAHYAMDVIAGRTLALYDMAHLLANDPAYVGQTLPKTSAKIKDFAAALAAAAKDLRAALVARCGVPIADCATSDSGRFSDPKRVGDFVAFTQTYTLPVVYPAQTGKNEDVYTHAKEAGLLLKTRFPALSLKQRDDILTRTEGPGGGFLDDGSEFGVYSRLDLYAAALGSVTPDGANRHAR